MTLMTALLIAATILLDVVGQLGFKLGVERAPAPEAGLGGTRFWSQLLRQPGLLLGVAAYALEFFLWLAVLSSVALSIAFPLASLSYCGVLIASRVVLKEAVSPRRWLGCGLISIGAALVCVGA
jgi:drug/metabolite transporter (DMT)-like permease